AVPGRGEAQPPSIPPSIGAPGSNGCDKGVDKFQEIGRKGPRGPRGKTGIEGPVGAVGSSASQGAPGIPGAPGNKGPTGQQGPEGVVGEPGNPGRPGKDAGYCPCPDKSGAAAVGAASAYNKR
uniref:Col_cuticle_N domain-containing protein n=1 Tax=Strongyloides stercoralis TaxID=6248 RepID=A0AAF5D161_STRER